MQGFKAPHVGSDVVLAAEVQHLLGLLDAANEAAAHQLASARTGFARQQGGSIHEEVGVYDAGARRHRGRVTPDDAGRWGVSCCTAPVRAAVSRALLALAQALPQGDQQGQVSLLLKVLHPDVSCAHPKMRAWVGSCSGSGGTPTVISLPSSFSSACDTGTTEGHQALFCEGQCDLPLQVPRRTGGIAIVATISGYRPRREARLPKSSGARAVRA